MVDFDHAVLFADVDVCQVLGLARASPQPRVPARRKSTIRYSDKKGVERFREFADKFYAKRRLHERMHDLIGNLELGDELAAAGLRDVHEEELVRQLAKIQEESVNEEKGFFQNIQDFGEVMSCAEGIRIVVDEVEERGNSAREHDKEHVK